ncbi:WEB family protein At5g16730, chloroplastic isoform X2 [Selaginella moellendorffii]|uniref:WEB family protein At5g16730, chloroplastic isoform X2 n=1 Tax=Selaginella moellendorffii TaxID=88036 RepID=UPI000D1CF327|nr:WEB family protein At5g16730, chloroplastic isoform X2 [Selaginella moellendorffii]|eukprot:XP_024525918.1 WEB family protein At5g16730, chloroplastic isoform X2 [Selaginella moellendorffii]
MGACPFALAQRLYFAFERMDAGSTLGMVREEDFLARKLDIQLDYWAAEKWQLENRLLVGERAHRHTEAFQSYENAQLALTLGLQQHELFLSKLKLDSVVDDLTHFQTRVTLLESQVRLEKVERLKQQQSLGGQSVLATKEAEFVDKLHDASQQIQDLRQEIHGLKLGHATEMTKVSKELQALLRERDFVWNQLKCLEADFCCRLKEKEAVVLASQEDIAKLRECNELAQRVGDERAVELTITKMELKKAEDESLEMKNMVAELMSEKVQTSASDELQNAYRRLEEVRLENRNLKELYAELEAKHDEKMRLDKPVKTGKKDVTTRNLSSEMEAAAGESGQCKRLRSRSRKARGEGEKTAKRTNRGENTGKRRQNKTSSSSGGRVLRARDSSGSATNTSFFSASFSIPKVKNTLAAVR